ncbi:hypothetical protein PVT68_02750 [Microbulbifer bruguierae]|uniref:Uncharacterized protein n=1 Tax=Microbulbifer bruguierae TaxID=3029061 RepID=A0ABY8NGQ3_9GAMM|nr:hypothetical protein [Microbulbifer bruguierae]WGL17227.1 hypothetical protein PVT68_02750 [Microbulbifer bruguierae]
MKSSVNLTKLAITLLSTLASLQTFAIDVASLEATRGSEKYGFGSNYQLARDNWVLEYETKNEELEQTQKYKNVLLKLSLASSKGFDELRREHENNEKEFLSNNPYLKAFNSEFSVKLLEKITIQKSLDENETVSTSDLTTYLDQKLGKAERDIEFVREEKEELEKEKHVQIAPLVANPSIATVGEDGKLTPQIQLSSWLPVPVNLKSKYRWFYGASVNLATGLESSEPNKAVNEFLQGGGDGSFGVSTAFRYISSDKFNVVIGASVSQAWLKSDVSENGEKIELDSEILQSSASIIFETEIGYFGIERSHNDYSGDIDNSFGQLLDQKYSTTYSFLTHFADDYYLQYKTTQGVGETISSISITKSLKLF